MKNAAGLRGAEPAFHLSEIKPVAYIHWLFLLVVSCWTAKCICFDWNVMYFL